MDATGKEETAQSLPFACLPLAVKLRKRQATQEGFYHN